MMNFPDAPIEGQVYGNYIWDNQKWMPLPATFADAPVTGKIYGRKDATWAEIISDVTKAYVDAEVAKRVLKAGDSMSGDLTTRDVRATRTTTTGAIYFGAGDTYLYWNGTNFSLSNITTAPHFNTTEGYAAQFGGTAPVGFHVDGTNIAIRPPPGGSIYFQAASGTSTFGYLNSGSLVLNNALSVAGTSTLAALTASSHIQFNQQAASLYQGSHGGILIYANGSAGYDAFISYWRPGGGYAANMGLMNNNRFGFGGWSVGGVQYQFWSREEYGEYPVHNVRTVHAGDYVHSSDNGLEEPYGPTACHTGCSGANPSGFGGSYLTQRYRYLQVRRADGNYGAEAG
jgi:hypothetical protein